MTSIDLLYYQTGPLNYGYDRDIADCPLEILVEDISPL